MSHSSSNVLYLDPNKNRTREWFQARGNVVPLGGTRFGFIRRIAQPDDSVKLSLRAPAEFADDGDVKFSRRDFASQIDDLTNGTFPRNDHLYVMETPQILLDAGLDELPILMTQKHARSVMKVSGGEDANYHGLTKAGMKQLPQAIADSALVIKAPGYNNRVIAFTSMKNSAGEVIIAPIEVAGRGVQNGKYIAANVLTTAYGKTQIKKMIVDAIMNDEVLSLDKEKSRQLAVNVGVQFPKIMRKGGPIRSIREFDQNVKRSLRAPAVRESSIGYRKKLRAQSREGWRFAKQIRPDLD